MSRSRSTERLAAGPGRRRVVLLLLAGLAPAALGACGKKGTLRLPRPDELAQDQLDEGDVLQDDELGGEDVPREDLE